MRAIRRVLVVDDDESTLEFFREVLRPEGYEVETARHGAAALDLVVRWRPHVILLDLLMPIMNGEEFLRTYHLTPPPHAPVIVLTATEIATPSEAPLDVDAFLTKPFNLDELLMLVDRYTG